MPRTSIGRVVCIRPSGLAKCGGVAVSQLTQHLAANSASMRPRIWMKRIYGTVGTLLSCLSKGGACAAKSWDTR